MKDYIIVGVVLLTSILVVASTTFAVTWFFAGFEARAYERVTGKHVSNYDAMFLELRVEGC